MARCRKSVRWQCVNNIWWSSETQQYGPMGFRLLCAVISSPQSHDAQLSFRFNINNWVKAIKPKHSTLMSVTHLFNCPCLQHTLLFLSAFIFVSSQCPALCRKDIFNTGNRLPLLKLLTQLSPPSLSHMGLGWGHSSVRGLDTVCSRHYCDQLSHMPACSNGGVCVCVILLGQHRKWLNEALLDGL